MSILRDQEADGTKYFVEAEGKITVKRSQEVKPIRQKNKRIYIINEVYSKTKEIKRVARITNNAL